MTVVEDPVYVHIGTGHTKSRYYCPFCDGYYGVPHVEEDGWRHCHPKSGDIRVYGCACRTCQGSNYPREGTMVPRWIMESLVEAEL